MVERVVFLKKRLADSRAYVDGIFDQVGDRWEMPVYSDGAGWNARQLVTHMADGEYKLVLQMKNIVANGESGVPPDFDVDRYNRRAVEKRAETTVEGARELLTTTRADLNAWLDTLDEAALEKTGRHPTLGDITVDMYARVIARHERDHATDLARALGISTDARTVND